MPANLGPPGAEQKDRNSGVARSRETTSVIEPSTDPSVRSASEHDSAALAELRAQWRLESHQVPLDSDPGYLPRFGAWFRAQLASGSLAWVAEDQEQVVGMLVMSMHKRMPEPGRPSTSWGYIGSFFVHPDHRGTGVGAALLSAVVDDAASRRLARIVLNPSPRSIPLYQRAGFSDDHGLLTLELSKGSRTQINY